MSRADNFKGYSWIKVPKYVLSVDKTWEERYAELERHHIQETQFLIDKIRELAVEIDYLKEWKE